MATKPTTLPRAWASLALYDTGPFIGSVMKVDPGAGIAASGHRPGALFPTPAEYENYQQNLITEYWVPWVDAGSFAGAADAHLLETDATGRTQAQGMTLDDAVNETVLSVIGVNTLAPAVLVDSTAGGGPGIQAQVDPNSFGFTTEIGAGTGTGVSVFLNNTLAGGAGHDVSDNAGSSGDGFRAVMSGAGDGVVSSSSGSGVAGRFSHTGVNAALSVVGSNSYTSAALFTGGTTQTIYASATGTAMGAFIRGGTTAGADGLQASTQNNTGRAVIASVPNTATSTARGLHVSTGTSAAVAAEFVAGGSGASGNYAAIFTGDTTSPQKGIIYMTPQNADPSAFLFIDGALAMSSTKGLTGGNTNDGTWRSYWHSLNGYACAFGTLTNKTTIGANLAYNNVGTITTANDGDQFKAANAQIIIRVTMAVRPMASAAGVYLGVRVQDTTGVAFTVFERSGAGGGDTAGFKLADNSQTWQSVCFTFIVTVPASGSRSYTLAINRDNAVNCEVRVRDTTMDFVGTVG